MIMAICTLINLHLTELLLVYYEPQSNSVINNMMRQYAH